MLFDKTRHEPLLPAAWDEQRARALIRRIVSDTEAHFSTTSGWPVHPRDGGPHSTLDQALYNGAGGVMWAVHHLQALGAVAPRSADVGALRELLARHHAWQVSVGEAQFASYMMGDLSLLLHLYQLDPTEDLALQIEGLIRGNLEHPSRELMWGAPGTMLAALFLHQHTGQARWAELFALSARSLWSQLLWSPQHQCHYWTQDMYASRSTYLDAVHGFVATASPIIRGRDLLTQQEWLAWQQCIENTVQRTATLEGTQANWRVMLDTPAGAEPRMLMQFCHGAPGFIICLADLPGRSLDALLLAAGEATWAAGPLTKGANLCHGTAGNGYALLKLYLRTGDMAWLERARAFAMHAIAQCERDALTYGQMHYSLWTGDLGLAIYLWDCVRAGADFPSLDVFFAGDGLRIAA